MRIARILDDKGGDIVSIAPDITVVEASKTLTEKRIGALLVTDPNGNISGVVSERDIVRTIAKRGREILDQPVSAIMTADVVTCSPQNTVVEAMGMMTRRRIRHLPVMNGGKLVGMVSIGDLVKYRIQETEFEAEALKEYIAAS
ncbi:MAG: CBS domain-containing protein [Pseudomonadota bacterium]